MNFGLRLAIVALSSFVAANLFTSAVLPMLLPRRLPADPRSRASALLRLRLLPAMLSTTTMALAIAAYLAFETRAHEATGFVLRLLAAGALLILIVSAARVLLLHVATRRALRTWLSTPQPIALDGLTIPAFSVESRFPVVAVVGVWRPRLIIARSVLAACPPEELRAILAHEQGHVLRRDNAKRALLEAAPDLLGSLPFSRRLAQAWHEATEQAADDEAGASGPHGRLHLAEALLRVARMVPADQRAPFLPASALFRGEDIAPRVRRLLAARVDAAVLPLSKWRRVASTAAFLAVSAVFLEAIHEVVEMAVTHLP